MGKSISDISKKTKRVLSIYDKLLDKKILNKSEEANRFNVNERTIQRDIDNIRKYLDFKFGNDNSITADEVNYDYVDKGFVLEKGNSSKLSNSEILAVCKILLDSRAFTKKEMDKVIGNIIECCSKETERKLVKDLIANEQYHYIEPQHKADFLEILWKIGQAIKGQKYIEIAYTKLKSTREVKRVLRPAAIMFSEFYFYLTAFIDDEETRKGFDVVDDVFPTIYRIDRIKSLKILEQKFKTPYRNRFEEGEFRKRVQFMYEWKAAKN